MRLVFRPEAQNEILLAQNWYEERAAGLGLEFARAVDVAVERVLRTPGAYASLDAKYRHLMLRKFPYSIVYHVTDTEIIVVSCFHHRRRPASWMRNVSN
jgi:plasmid stabilization system protein ParE